MTALLHRRLRRPRLSGGVALLCLLGPAFLPTLAAAEGKGETIVLASGPEGGVYHSLASAIQERLGEVRVVSMPDCAASLTWLEETPEDPREVRFAFAQQDVVGERFRTSPGTPIRVVDRTAYDYLHIFVRQSLHVESVSDLAGLTVWMGEEGTAVRSTAKGLLESFGVWPKRVFTYRDLQEMGWQDGDLRAEDYAVRELSNWLREGRVDAVMLVAPVGAPEVVAIARRGEGRLLSLTPENVRKLWFADPKNNPFLRHLALGPIPQRTYEHQQRPVSAAAVQILLLARDGTDSDLAKKVRAAARDAWQTIQPDLRHPAPQPLAAPGLKWLRGVDEVTDRSPMLPGIVIGALAMLLVLVSLCRQATRRWARRLRRTRRVGQIFSFWYQFSRVVTVAVITLGASMLVITSLIWLSERHINEHFETFQAAWWSITLYIFSGLESRAPQSPAGHVLGAMGLGIGWLLSIGITGKVIEILIRRERRMPRRLKNHYVLLNWNERGMDLLGELHHPELEKCERLFPVALLTDDQDLELRLFSAFADVYPRIGDPTDEEDLRRVNSHHARTIVILADEERGDEWALRSILKLRKLAAEHKDLHVVVELIDPANSSILEDLAETFPGRLEYVSGPKLRTCVIAQAALTEGITDFYTDLLSVKKDSNEVYAVPIPPAATGWTFREYSAFVVQNAKPSSPMIPVGVHRRVDGKAKVFTNPKGDDDFRLRAGDQLIVIAYGPPPKDALPTPPRPPATEPASHPAHPDVAAEIAPPGGSTIPPQPVSQVQ